MLCFLYWISLFFETQSARLSQARPTDICAHLHIALTIIIVTKGSYGHPIFATFSSTSPPFSARSLLNGSLSSYITYITISFALLSGASSSSDRPCRSKPLLPCRMFTLVVLLGMVGRIVRSRETFGREGQEEVDERRPI